ncbi:unnamed protein product, partial [Cladocopium goreaui]
PAIALAATATGFKMPAVSQGLFSPVKLGGAPAALVGPPPKVRMAAPAAPMRPEEPYHVLDLEDGPAADLQEASLIQTSPEERRGAGSPPKVSLLTYLERYGGYRGQREAGLSMWILASSDFSATKEFLALGVMALEQSVFDAGD